MKLKITEEWCMKMANLEGDSEIGAGYYKDQNMKDHELRELINAVTAAARIYAGTQQLRERIAHLIKPAFRKLQCESEFRQGMVEGKDVIIEMREAQITELQRENAEYIPVINMLILCGEEPCRTTESYPDKLRALIDAYITIKRQLAAAQAAANNSSVENIVLKKRLFQAKGGH